MCGIVGAVAQPSTVLRLDEAQSALKHRGPDGSSTFVNQARTVMLAHNRLAVIDLSSRARQPMSTPDGQLTIVFNGEIYNYIELRNELASQGIQFTTDSDTEVLLNGYRWWGDEILARLVGMFAFAVWDSENGELFLARDRLGKKPLLYCENSNAFAFASELKALLATGITDARLDPIAIDAYLALGYVPAPLTAIKSIRKLQPGHFLRHKSNRTTIARYWYPEQSPSPQEHRTDKSAQDISERLKTLVGNAVRLRMRADVPLGVFLSGGLDSSIVALESCRQGTKPHAMTVQFSDDDADVVYARRVADHLALSHDIIRVEDRLESDIPNIFWQYDEPIADSSIVPSYLLARAVNGRFKVVLNGDGGDEVFGGYQHYEHVAAKQFVKAVGVAAGLRDGSPLDAWQVYVQSKVLFRHRERRRLLDGHPTSNSVTGIVANNPFFTRGIHSALKRAMAFDLHCELPNRMLYKMDIALAAFGMEGRSPLLDHRLVEWCRGLPETTLVKGTRLKYALRKAYEADLPSSVIERPKQGFGAPISNWLRHSLSSILHDLLPTPLFSDETQRSLMMRFHRGKDPQIDAQIWTVLSFAIWSKAWRVQW